MKSCVLILSLLTLVAEAGASGAQLEEMTVAKKKFASLPNPADADRQNYLLALSKLRESLANNASGEDCFKVDAEIRRYPAPENTEVYTKLMAGKWSSLRHEYIYRADGTWIMLPEEDGGNSWSLAHCRQPVLQQC